MRWKEKISEHISYTDAIKSDTGIRKNIDNNPSEEILATMKYVAENVFEPIIAHFEVPIGITSFFRCEALNNAVGGSKTSDHITGSAIDIDSDIYGMITNQDIFNFVRDNLNFDQLIWEFGNDKEPAWVHVSLKKENNKKEILRAIKQKNWKGQSITKYIKL